MIQSRGNATTLVRSQSSKDVAHKGRLAEAVPYILMLTLLGALSLLWAIKDPLAFSEIFGRM
jgi:hypothetical protein